MLISSAVISDYFSVSQVRLSIVGDQDVYIDTLDSPINSNLENPSEYNGTVTIGSQHVNGTVYLYGENVASLGSQGGIAIMIPPATTMNIGDSYTFQLQTTQNYGNNDERVWAYIFENNDDYSEGSFNNEYPLTTIVLVQK